MIVSAICTVFSAAPFRRLSDTHHSASPFSTVASLADARHEGGEFARGLDRRHVTAGLALNHDHHARCLAQG